MYHGGGSYLNVHYGREHLKYHLYQPDASELSFSLWQKRHFQPCHLLWDPALLELHLSYNYQGLPPPCDKALLSCFLLEPGLQMVQMHP